MILMTTPSYSRKALSVALSRVLAPAQLTAAREMIMAADPSRAIVTPEDILYWMRVNMPRATEQVEELLNDGE